MARITCSKSGIVFQCEHLPLTLHSSEVHHPLFSLSKKKLLPLHKEYLAGNLSVTESYLLYLSLLNSTDLLVWRTQCRFTTHTPSIVANNMEQLISIIGKIDIIHHPSFTLPKFSISYDTADLSNSFHWIQAWTQQYSDWYDGLKEARYREELKSRIEPREAALQRTIKTFFSDPAKLASKLSEWAEYAGDFPQFLVTHPFTKGKKLSLSEYWKELIRACVIDDKIWQYPKKDIEELIDHCEDNIENTSIYSHKLFQILSSGLESNLSFAGFGDIGISDVGVTKFTVLSPTTSAEDANKLALAHSAPLTEPRPSAYTNKFAYLKDKAKWDMAQKYGAQK